MKSIQPPVAYPAGLEAAERTTAHLAAARAHFARAAAHIGQAARQMMAERRRERARRRQIHLLARLDERTLKDIGLHRAEIGSLADEMHGSSERTRRQAGPHYVSPLY